MAGASTPTITVLTSGGSDTDAASFTTASISPKPNSLIIAMAWMYDTAGGFGHSTASYTATTGGGMTFTAIAGQGYTGQFLGGGYAFAPLNVGSGTITLTSNLAGGANAEGAVWLVVQIEGATGVGTVPAFGGDSYRTTLDTLTLPALTLRSEPNLAMAFFGSWDNAGGALDFTEESGWTMLSELSQTVNADTLRICCVYDLDSADTTASASVSAANDRMVGTRFEIILNEVYPQFRGILLRKPN